MTEQSWQPTAKIHALKARAQLFQDIRAYFNEMNVMEVDTPTLAAFSSLDAHIECPKTQLKLPSEKTFYLQSSPEFAMKRLIAAGSGCIYQLGKAFRQEELGRLHNPEFTLLEWYRIGFNLEALMQDVENLVKRLISADTKIHRISYASLFQQHLGVNPHQITAESLLTLTKSKIQFSEGVGSLTQTDCLMLLFSELIEPSLIEPTFVYHFPKSQCALAKVTTDKNGHQVALRFELYMKGTELANGYDELNDPREQKIRFLAQAKENNLSESHIDHRLLDALRAGMPDCAGVALGVDRLLMLMLDEQALDAVIPFPATVA